MLGEPCRWKQCSTCGGCLGHDPAFSDGRWWHYPRCVCPRVVCAYCGGDLHGEEPEAWAYRKGWGTKALGAPMPLHAGCIGFAQRSRSFAAVLWELRT